MVRRLLSLLLTGALLTAAVGCASILNGQTSSVTRSVETVSPSPSGPVTADSYDTLVTAILGLIETREEKGDIRVDIYTGDLKADVDRAVSDIPKNTPLGAYAVSSLSGSVTTTDAFNSVEVRITYKNITKEQLQNITTVSTERYLKSVLHTSLTNGAVTTAVNAKGLSLTSDAAKSLVTAVYNENPSDIVMLPTTSLAFYPDTDTGGDKIVVFTFSYRYGASTLKAMEKTLQSAVERICSAVSGTRDGDILLALCQKLMVTVTYSTEPVMTAEEKTPIAPNTAYDALITGVADSSGYARAFNALCDKLRIPCVIVSGTFAGQAHTWNIVTLDGHAYHIDVSQCDENGIAAAFLKNDTEMKNSSYSWDTAHYAVCDGPLTYRDFYAHT
ncbi:hypothetical protein IZU99_06880 [Oscillospiraceae bacterium CM]|nr:hypothetical protein IZU99_06880 [Oscillospiraceae bacterium CM]